MATKQERQHSTTFVDTGGKAWDTKLDAVIIQAVREQHNIDLVAVTDQTTWKRIEDDLVLQVDVLATVLADQIKERDLSAHDFARCIGPGDVLDQAYMALLDAIENFIPPRRRELWRTLCKKNQMILERGMNLAIEKVEDPKLEEDVVEAMGARMDSEVEKQLTQLRAVGNTPESAESDPTG